MGAVSLIYLGVRMWGASGTLDLSARGSIKLLILIFHQTIVMNLINLKVALFFGVPSSICGSRNRPYANSICFVRGHFYDQYIIVMGRTGLVGGQVSAFLGKTVKWTLVWLIELQE
jgi:threonine/homoserine/homoserine lactone efflux protein